jgi:hypothetical protein
MLHVISERSAISPQEFRPREFRMRLTILAAACVVVGFSSLTETSRGQPAARVARAEGTPSPATNQSAKFTFLLFWKENNTDTQRLTENLKSAVTKRAERAEWTAVNVNDSASRPIVERYQVSRVPMPTVLCIAPNGGITGVFVRKLSDEAVDDALVTSAMADATKALQDKKIVLVHVKSTAGAPLPDGAAAIQRDPSFQSRTVVVELLAADPAESRFLADLEINSQQLDGSMVVVLAPPGVLVGKFKSNATMSQIAQKLHAAGKCCNDPKCKHNKKSAE